ncbi:Serine/threonine-protein phosphatase PP1 [Xylariaceae sp. FL1272]|nr:Serine/threonine-protein phosphatase PP1 [Xylariaceae sp. FL1272]
MEIPNYEPDVTSSITKPPFSEPTTSTQDSTSEVDLDSIIKHLSQAQARHPRKEDQLSEEVIRYLCTKAKDLLLSQPSLLELQAPITIVGDLRGYHDSLLRTFEINKPPPENKFLFLGGYTQLTRQGIEVMCLCLAYKIKYPDTFFLLRGNRECGPVTRIRGLYDECKNRYTVSLWKAFGQVFDVLPLAAVIDDRVFCVHGGLSPELESMEQIRGIERPVHVPDHGLVCDLLWSDPHKSDSGWSGNDRGVSVTFGADIVQDFLKKHNLDLIVRGHQVVKDGYEFWAEGKLVTLCGTPDFSDDGNAAAIMSIDERHQYTFNVFEAR